MSNQLSWFKFEPNQRLNQTILLKFNILPSQRFNQISSFKFEPNESASQMLGLTFLPNQSLNQKVSERISGFNYLFKCSHIEIELSLRLEFLSF